MFVSTLEVALDYIHRLSTIRKADQILVIEAGS